MSLVVEMLFSVCQTDSESKTAFVFSAADCGVYEGCNGDKTQQSDRSLTTFKRVSTRATV